MCLALSRGRDIDSVRQWVMEERNIIFLLILWIIFIHSLSLCRHCYGNQSSIVDGKVIWFLFFHTQNIQKFLKTSFCRTSLLVFLHPTFSSSSLPSDFGGGTVCVCVCALPCFHISRVSFVGCFVGNWILIRPKNSSRSTTQSSQGWWAWVLCYKVSELPLWPWDLNGNESHSSGLMASLDQATWKEKNELDTPHKWLRAIDEFLEELL